MVKKVATVGLLAVLGFVVGYASTWLGGERYYVGSALWLPRHSQHSPSELVAMTAGRHPGAEVRAVGGNKVSVVATGSLEGAEEAVRAGYRAVLGANDGKFQFLPFDHVVEPVGHAWGSPVRNGGLGLLAGISVALGFLVPSRVVLRPSQKRKVAKVVALSLIGGVAVQVVLLLLAVLLLAYLIRQPAMVTGGL
jgi:hypothetical protein